MPIISGITVPGTAGGNIVVSTGTGDYLNLAQQMANALNGLRTVNNLVVTTVTAGSAIPPASGGGKSTEIGLIGAGGVVSVLPTSNVYSYVVNVTSSPETVTASNTQVLSGDQGATLLVSDTSTVAATGGNNFVSGTGNFLLSTATGNDTIFASGSGTVAAGAGANFVSVSGSGNYVISAGTGDTIRQGSGPVSVLAVGTGSNISGSANAGDTLAVSLGGSGNTLYANLTQAAVTISGFTSPVGVTTTGTNNIVEGGAAPVGTLNVVDVSDFAIITGNADSVVSATVSGNSTLVIGGSGTLNVSASGANDTVAAGSAASSVTLSGSTAFLFGNTTGVGTLTAVDASNNSVITPRNEASTITLSGASSKVNAGSASLNLSITGSNDTVFAGTGAETIQTTTNPLVFAPNGGTLNFVGGAGVPTIIGATGGSEHVTVGSGGISYASGSNDNATITSGTGQATIFGSNGGYVNFVGTAPGGAQFHAYGGNETLSGAGSSTNNSFFGSPTSTTGTTKMIGGSGNDLFIAGANAETITGGGGSDVFAFFKQTTKLGPASVTITDFNSADTVFIVGYDSTKSASSLLANATGPAVNQTGPGLTLTLSDNTTVTFSNLTSVTQLYGHIGYFGPPV
jgi:hypothetical protein